VPAPVIDAESIRLSRAVASKGDIFRTAEARAKADGLRLEVESIEEAFGSGTEAGTGNNGTGGESA
jgi:hypothetical protein